MKKNFFLIGCIAFPILAVIAFFIGLKQPYNRYDYSKPVKSNSWLQISPNGMVMDYNEVEYGFMGKFTSVDDICSKIKKAAFDNNIKGIYIKPGFIQINTTGINEIGTAISEFKQTGKPVLAFLDMQSQKDYLLASYADKIGMEPSASAGLFFDGVQANISFYKNLLDKLGLKINVIKSGTYKGYGETYSSTSLSSETHSNLKDVLGDRYNLIIDKISKQRKLSTEQVKDIFEKRPDLFISANYAKEVGLIDDVVTKDAFLKQNNIEKKQLLLINDYSSASINKSVKNKIAVCYLQGSITPKIASQLPEGINSDKVQNIIEQIQKDKSIKAVVLRINSPGGSALESDIIYKKMEQLKSQLPIVVSMGGVAASGGYYISAPADYIVADPFTITGSIGVIQLLPDATELGKKIGINNQTIAYGKFADAYNFLTPPSSELLVSLQRSSDNVYNEFKQRVVKYRKIDYDELENLAGGRIWSAEDAMQNHLIDQVGSLNDAIMKAAELAKIKTYQTTVLPQKKQYWEYLFEQINQWQVVHKPISIKDLSDIVINQMRDIFKPYSVLCIMPFELE